MIARLDGKLINKSPETAIIDVNGVVYEINLPLSTFYKLPDINEQVCLHIHTCIKDDAIVLSGFLTIEEKEVFELLIGVTGIGPKLARNILSGISVDDFKGAVTAKELPILVKVPGLGKKTAERLILELSDKLDKLTIDAGASTSVKSVRVPIDDDVVSALVNLGYKEANAREALGKAKESVVDDDSFEDIFKRTLKALSDN